MKVRHYRLFRAVPGGLGDSFQVRELFGGTTQDLRDLLDEGWLPEIAGGTTDTFTSDGNWTAAVTDPVVECWGGGGGGGGGVIIGSGGGGGGGGGAYSKKNVTGLTVSNNYAVVVGAGGTGGASGADGGVGGDATFNSTTCVAKGGNGGLKASQQTGGTGGAAASGTGDTKFSGGNGGNGHGSQNKGGGGGSSGGTAANGNAGGTGASGGAGGTAPTGGFAGGAGGNSSGGSQAPDANGGGAGGGCGGGGTGGAGRPGKVTITYTTSTPATVTPGTAAGVATPTLLVTAATRMALGTAAGVGDATLSVKTPALIQPGVSAGQGSAAGLVVEVPQPAMIVMGVAAGQGGASAGVSAATQVIPGPSAGTGAATTTISRPAQLIMSSSDGQGATALTLKTAAQILLAPSAGVATVTALVRGPPSLTLSPSAGVGSTANIAVATPVSIVLGPSAGHGSTTLLTITRRIQRLLTTRLRPRLEHYTMITPPEGVTTKFSAQARDPQHILQDVSYGDSMPGGYEAWEARLVSDPRVFHDKFPRLSDVQHYDAGGERVWEGRVHGAPESSGDVAARQPRANGYQSHLEDNKSVRMIPVNANLSDWQGMNNQRKQQRWNNDNVPDDGSIDWDVAAPAIILTFPTADVGSPFVEMWFYAPGIGIGRIWYQCAPMTAGITADANYNASMGVSSTSVPSVLGTDYESGGDKAGSASFSGYLVPTNLWDFAWAQFSWNQTTKTENKSEQFKFWDVRIYDGNITLRGSDPKGVYASDAIAHGISQWAPLLVYTQGADGTIVDTDDFVIPHLSFRENTTLTEVIQQAMRFHTNSFDWAVWNRRKFYIQPRGSGRKWRARTGPAQLQAVGQQVERVWNGVMVKFTAGDGVSVVVGPPGSGADVTSSMLQDLDPDNPANKAGIDKWQQLSMNYSTPAGAIQVGAEFLARSLELDQSGEATLTGYVEDEHGVMRPYSHVHADDVISFVDSHDTSYRRISSTSKSDSQKTCSISLDAPPEGLQALLEQLDVSLVPLGFGNG